MSHPENESAAASGHTGFLPTDLYLAKNAPGLVDALFEGHPDLVLVVGADGRIAAANSRALADYGYSRQQLEGQPLNLLLPQASRDRHTQLMDSYMRNPASRPMGSCMNLKAVNSQGHQFPVDVMLWPLKTSQSGYVIAVCHRLEPALARAQMQIHALVDDHRDHAVNLLDPAGRILTWNEGARRIYNLSGSDALGKYYSILFTPGQIDAGQPEKHLQEAARSGESQRTAAWRSRGDGARIWAETHLTCTKDPSGAVIGFTIVLRDLSTYKRSEEALLAANHALLESEQRFRLLVENVTDYAIYMIDPQGRVVTWNAGAERSKGYTPEEILGQNYSLFFLPEDVEAGVPEIELAEALKSGSYRTENWRLRKNGTKFWASVTLTAIHDSEGKLKGFAKVTRDLTAHKRFEQSLATLASDLEARVAERTSQLESTVEELRRKHEEVEALVAIVSHDLGEKEILLREVYHRVKNNLQVVQSLLKMGSRTLQSGDAKLAIDTAVQRVHVMATVHEHLYQMPDLAGLPLSEYLRDIVEGAIGASSEQPQLIHLDLECDEIPLSLDLAIPCGLLINELVSNCIKHGIPAGRPGRIMVSARIVQGKVRLAVQDDGKGLPENFDLSQCTSMGLKLAASLAHQLGGQLQFSSGHGCRAQCELGRINLPPAAPVAGAVVHPAAIPAPSGVNGRTVSASLGQSFAGTPGSLS